MKKIVTVIVAVTLLVGCSRKADVFYSATGEQVMSKAGRRVVTSNAGRTYMVEVVAGHEYLIWKSGYNASMAHAGNCIKCTEEK